MSICLIFGYFLCFIIRCQSSDEDSHETEAIVHTNVEAPNFGEKVIVDVGMLIQSIGNFDTRKMSIDVDFYLHMSWTDNRLMHNRSTYMVVSDYRSLKRMWLPDLYMVNSKRSRFHTVSKPNFCIWIMPNGQVAYSVRITSSVSCPLNLVEYPLDEQICEIKLMSYGYRIELLEFKWFENDAVKLNDKIELPELGIVGHGLDTCNHNYSYAKTSNHTLTGEFSCLTVIILFKRAISYHLVETFIPTGLIVGISWISFWLDRNAVPARVTLSFTTLLTLSTMVMYHISSNKAQSFYFSSNLFMWAFNQGCASIRRYTAAGVRFGLPPVSYAKAIDIWMGACTFLVFGALLEFAIVNSYNQHAVKCDDKAEKLTRAKIDASVRNAEVTDTESSIALLKEERNQLVRKAQHVDEVSRILFPASFLIFNILFWLICLDVVPVLEWFGVRSIYYNTDKI